ncbi:hypothetical protein MRX96_048587 [Rhipicephalus microplus]
MNSTPFYRHVLGIYKRIAVLNLDIPILGVRNTELTQELLVNSGCESKNPGFSWVLLTPSWLPGSIQDVVWHYGWSVLPTVNRMYKWHYVRSEQCVQCGMYEDNEHALLTCRVANAFWSLVDKAYHLLGVERFVKRKRCPNGALARLVLTAVTDGLTGRALGGAAKVCAPRFFATKSFQSAVRGEETVALMQPAVSICVPRVARAIVNAETR